MPAVRINKYLAHATGMSRRQADEAVAAGRVTIDGVVAEMGAHVPEYAIVTLDGALVGPQRTYTYILLHKPVGYVCSRRRQGDTPTIFELLPQQYRRLKPVGRLDKDSSGLLLLTDDGDFAHRMTHPKFSKTKTYEVKLDKPLEPLHQQMISDYGVTLEDGVSQFLVEKYDSKLVSKLASESEKSQEHDKRVTRGGATSDPNTTAAKHLQPKFVDAPGPSPERGAKPLSDSTYEGSEKTYQITMHEGRNRQIRRTFAALGYTVTKLHRISFGNYSLGDIKSGEHTLVDSR